LKHRRKVHSAAAEYDAANQDLSKPSVLSSLQNSDQSNIEKLESRPLEAIEVTAEAVCTATEITKVPVAASEDDDPMNDEEDGFESEDDCMEAHWVPADGDFEASVLRATGNDPNLAARLMEELYDMFQEERSPVVGFWQAVSYKQAGVWDDSATRAPGGWSETHGNSPGHNSYDRSKRRRTDGGEEGEEDGNNHGGNGGGGRKLTSGEATYGLPLACPFNRRDPQKYCISRSPLGKNFEYRTCQTPFMTHQRFK
jgi:hypothetical protein